MNSFYAKIEETVRPYVETLRQNGINTTASCEHDGYILATSLDSTKEHIIISEVLTVMFELKEWTAILTVEYSHGNYHNIWEIKSPHFEKNNPIHIQE